MFTALCWLTPPKEFQFVALFTVPLFLPLCPLSQIERDIMPTLYQQNKVYCCSLCPFYCLFLWHQRVRNDACTRFSVGHKVLQCVTFSKRCDKYGKGLMYGWGLVYEWAGMWSRCVFLQNCYCLFIIMLFCCFISDGQWEGRLCGAGPHSEGEFCARAGKGLGVWLMKDLCCNIVVSSSVCCCGRGRLTWRLCTTRCWSRIWCAS